MDRVDDAFKADIQWSHGKDGKRIVVVQQLGTWAGWDNIKHAMEIAKANVMVEKGLSRLAELTKPDPEMSPVEENVGYTWSDDLAF